MSRSVSSRVRFLTAALFALAAAAAWAQPASTPPPRKRIGVLTDNYPFSFRDAKGAVRGFAYELLREVEQVEGLDLEQVVGATNEINPAFRAGQLDALQSYADFPEREAEADFSFPYLTMAGAIFVREGEHAIRRLEDLRGRKVLVHPGSQGEAVLRRAGLAESIVFVESVELALTRLARGEGDATLATRLTGLALSHQLKLTGLRPVEAPVPGYEVRYCIAVREGDRELLARVNEGLAVLVRTGRFDVLYRKWFGHIEPTGYTTEQIVLAVAVGLALALAVAIWAMLRQSALRRRLACQAEALRESEEQHREIFEGAHHGLLVLGRSAESAELVVQQANPAAQRMLGHAEPAAIGVALAQFLAAAPELGARIARAALSSSACEFEHTSASRPGGLRVGVSRFGERTLVTITDISEQIEAREGLRAREDQLQRTQRLEAIGTFAGGIAHDFNNVLTTIFGNAQLGLLAVSADHPAAHHQEQVLKAARRARDLVRQILAFSRRTESKRQPTAVTPIIEETIAFLRSVSGGAISFEHRRATTLPLIIADPSQVHQVLMNLGTNAVQALRGTHGRITFREEHVPPGSDGAEPLAGLPPGEYVRIGVSDTGPGMTPEVRERIFEPFFTTKSPGEGTGLGLSVVHGIVQQHGGAVTVESEPGRGTCFQLYFPVAAAEAPAVAEEPVDATPRGRNELILLVDDDDAIVDAGRQILGRLGYRVSAHQRSADAMAELAARPGEFALIVSDLTMPDVTGLQLAAHVRGTQPGTPFVLMSGYFSDGEREEAQAIGITTLLPKPFTIQTLARAIAGAAKREA